MPTADAGGNGGGLPTPEDPKKKKLTPQQYKVYELLKQADRQVLQTWHEIAAAPDVPRYPLIGHWLFPGAWLFVGKAKSGKGWLELQMANAVLTGGEFLGWQCQKAEVLSVFAEDHNQRIKERLASLGIANGTAFPPPDGGYVINRQMLKELVHKFNAETSDAHLTFQGFLSRWLLQHPKVKLVLIDTELIIRLRWKRDNEPDPTRGKRVTEIDYEQSTLWDDFASENGLVIVLVNHPGKDTGFKRDPHEMINTSGTKMAGASGSIVLYQPREVAANQFVFSIKGRDVPGAQIDLAVHQEDSGAFVADGPWQQVSQTLAENHQLEALRVQHDARGFDPNSWVMAKELADYLNKSAAAVNRTFSRMLAKGNVTWKGFRLLSSKGKGYRLELMDTSDTSDTKEVKTVGKVGASDTPDASDPSDRSDIRW